MNDQNDARCPLCHKALLCRWDRWDGGSTYKTPAIQTSCRSCRGMVSFILIATSTKPLFVSQEARKPTPRPEPSVRW